MRVWARQTIDAPAEALWHLLTDTEQWPLWGPSIRRVEADERMIELGSKGRVITVVGLALPFEITEFEEGSSWTWQVAGLPATAHDVAPRGDRACRVGFGVPIPVAPYLATCKLALRRLEKIAEAEVVKR